MTSASSQPLVVGILSPRGFDTTLIEQRLHDVARPVELVVGDYGDSLEVLSLRDRGRPRAEYEHLLPALDERTREILARAEILVSRDAPLDLVGLAPSLKVFQGTGAGVAHLDVPALARQGIRVAHGAGVQAVPIAEFVLARLLSVWKGLRDFDASQQRHAWERRSPALVAGRTLGIVGLGAIGTAIAQRAKAFDLRVLATRRRYQPGMAAPFVDELHGPDGLDHLLRASDAVVLCLPATDDTHDLIGPSQLELMRPGAVLCNVARGALVDEEALVAALEGGHLGAAILDVTRLEPLPPDSPLYGAPNLYLSPHSSGSEEGAMDRLATLVAMNIVRYSAGQALINERDPSAGY